ncbi:MAG TPA: helix-turn-helix domain-containing protein [Thiopseudomonas sp.]|nr:helix-turn-helix domain-containing protein [Thiopseudomonas sp.]
MTNQKKAARAGEQGGQDKAKDISVDNYTSSSPAGLVTNQPIEAIQSLKPGECRTKKERVLNHLTHYGSINRFEASKLLYDTALNSTISFLANAHGITFDKLWESVPNRVGSSTKVKRYSLAIESRAAALKLLDHWRMKP